MTRTADSERDGPRPALTRAHIVHAAIGLIEGEGVDALSMRRVAAELGVAVMSLYNHVPNKGALLQDVAEHVVAVMDFDCDPSEPWTERARALVRAFRKVAHDYPRCMSIVFTREVGASAGLRPAERALAVAESAGFDGETSVRIMRALMAYALGAQMREVGAARTFDRLPDEGAEAFAHLDPAEFPHVIALAPQLARHDPETDFEFGLDLLITALDGLPRARAVSAPSRQARKPGRG